MSRKLGLLNSFISQHGEGPVWDDQRNRLYWVDIKGQNVCNCSLTEPEAVNVIHLDKAVGCVALTREGTDLLVGMADGIARVSASVSQGNASNQPTYLFNVPGYVPGSIRINDGKCDPLGRFWFGTMALDDKMNGRASLYRMDENFQTREVLTDITTSNGLAWAEDSMYFIDSQTRNVDRFEFDQDKGLPDLRTRKTIASFSDSTGAPDGMTIDSSGDLWIALWGGRKVVCLDPITGALKETINIPVENVSSCCFGGTDLSSLFITTAQTEKPTDLTTPEEHAGKIFVVPMRERLGTGSSYIRQND